MAELSRSLRTSDHREARDRCLQATCWFRDIVDKLGAMSTPTRADLERAAVEFFDAMAEEVEQREGLELDNLKSEIAFNIEESRRRSSELRMQLSANAFDGPVISAADGILKEAGGSGEARDAGLVIVAQQLAARAELEQLQLLIHALTSPGKTYEHCDLLFARRHIPEIVSPVVPNLQPAMSLRDAGTAYLLKKKKRQLSQTHVDELARALGWLGQRFGGDRLIGAIEKFELARFRDDIARLDVRMRGREVPFDDRLTNDAEHQVKSVTAERYWRSVQGFFAWAEAEGYAADDLASSLKLEGRKGEQKNTPVPFSKAELQRLFETPLYAGYLSNSRVSLPGACVRREGRWWSGVLSLLTGLRAGELAQLLPCDFDFVSETPHLKVRVEDASGKKIKTAKNVSSIRDVPLSPVLIELGLREFVSQRAKRRPDERIFVELRLGARGRKSDGMTKFWSRYLKAHGLWTEGRATHVFRHTITACLRSNNVADEDIGALLGHSRQTVTAGYGGPMPLSRKLKAVQSLDYGFDFVGALGGPYEMKRHG